MRKITLLFLSVLTLAACTKTGLNLPADSNNNINLNTLLTLKSGVNNVFRKLTASAFPDQMPLYQPTKLPSR